MKEQNKAQKAGTSTAQKMMDGADPLLVSIDEFKKGAIENGCPDALLAFLEFGFWMGASATMTRCLYMVEATKEGKPDCTPDDLLQEISDGLNNTNTSEMFRPFKP